MTITRFAPSPTGLLHLGNLRAAIFNWAIARRDGGTFILRLDDTDPERSREEFAGAIREDLTWLGLAWDREEKQSDRLPLYMEAAEALKASGRLYPCWETPEELERRRRIQRAQGRPPVYDRAALSLTEAEKAALQAERAPHWRFRLDHERIEWEDGVLGFQSIDAGSVSDPVLIRADGQVLYTLASAVDDPQMGITDVVRGADHVTNTAAQIQIIRALGYAPPRFAHHSLLTGPDGEALSKRLGALSLRELRAEGIEPMAVLSLLARLGSSDPVEVRQTPQEVFEGFVLNRFGAARVKLDPADLGPLSARTLHGMPFSLAAPRLEALGVTGDEAEAFWAAVGPNLTRFEDAADWLRIAREGPEAPDVDPEDAEFVAHALTQLPARPWDETTWGAWTGALKAGTGRKGKALFLPLRRALTGRRSGPDMRLFLPLMQTLPRL